MVVLKMSRGSKSVPRLDVFQDYFFVVLLGTSHLLKQHLKQLILFKVIVFLWLDDSMTETVSLLCCLLFLVRSIF